MAEPGGTAPGAFDPRGFDPVRGPRRPGHLKRPGRGPLTGQTLRVRPAQADDAQAIFALYRAVLEEGQSFLAAPDELGPQSGLGAVERCALIAQTTDKDGLIGAILLREAPLRRLQHSRTVELFVAAGARGSGAGGALLDAALAWSRARPELRWLRLSVYADNDAAIGLYSARGFVVEGRRPGFSVEPDGQERDDLLMALDLRAG